MKKNGFTIVELLIVISIFAVIVVMLATISPAVAKRSKLNRAANELVSDIIWAKQLATSENRFVVIDFSDDGTSYIIRKQVNVMNFDPLNLTQENSWTPVRTARPLDGSRFFSSEDVTDFAFNSTGMTRLLDLDNPDPALIDLTIFIEKKESPGQIDFSKKIMIFPYGGLKIEE